MRSMTRNAWIVVAGVAGVAVVVVAYLLWDGDAPEPITPPPELEAEVPEPRPIVSVPASDATATEEVVAAEPAPEPPVTHPVPPDLAVAVPAPIVLPLLAASDAFVREHLAPELGAAGDAWLDEPDLALRAAAVIANGRDGNVPRRLLGFVTVPGKFAVEGADGRTVIAPETHARFDAVVQTVTAIPPVRAAELVVLFEPLLRDALRALASGESPRRLLLATLDEVLRTPITEGPIAVEQPKVLYRFADPALEGRSPLQKQLLRMGPANVRALQAYARQLRRELAAG